MKTAKPGMTSGRIVMVSLLTAGLLLSASGFSRGARADGYESQVESRHGAGYEKGANHLQRKMAVVRELPRGYRTVVVGKTRYYEHGHRYYSRVSDGYALLRPPVGAVFATLPIGSVRVTIGGPSTFGPTMFTTVRYAGATELSPPRRGPGPSWSGPRP